MKPERQEEFRLIPEKWRTGYLAACVVMAQSSRDVVQQDWYFLKRGEKSNVFTAFFRNADDESYLVRGISRANRPPEPPDGIESLLVEQEYFRRYRVVQLYAKLSQACYAELVRISRLPRGTTESVEGYNREVNRLVNAVIKGFDGNVLHEGRSYRAFHHVLYLEPESALVCRDAEIQQLALEVRRYFDSSPRNNLPSRLDDMILMPGVAYGNHETSCLMVRLEPHSVTALKEDMHVPRLLADFLNHIARNQLEGAYVSRLQDLQMSREEYWEIPTTMVDFGLYRTKYLAERLVVQNAILDAEELSDGIDGMFPIKALYRSDFATFDGAFELGVYGDFSKSSVNDRVFFQRKGLDEALAASRQTLKRRLNSLDSYLQTVAEATTSSANIELSKRIHWLTIVLVALAVVGMPFAILPDEYKKHVVDYVLNALISVSKSGRLPVRGGEMEGL